MAFSLGLSMPEDASSQALANMARGGGSNGVSLGLLPSRPVAMDSPPPLSAEAPEETAPAGPAMPAQPAPSPVASGGASVPAGVGAPVPAPPAAQQAPLVDFHKNPLGAIGFVLASAAAGMRGDPGGPTRDIQKVQLEQQAQAYKTAELGLNAVEAYTKILANADPSTHADIIAHAKQITQGALGGMDISPILTALSSGSKAQNTARLTAIKALNVSPEQLGYFAANPQAAVKFLDDYNDTQAKQSADTGKYSDRAETGINPATGKPELFYHNTKDGSVMWSGVAPNKPEVLDDIEKRGLALYGPDYKNNPEFQAALKRGMTGLKSPEQEAQELRIAQGKRDITINSSQYNLTPDETKALNDGIANGTIDPNKITSRTAKIFAAMKIADPSTDFVSAGGVAALKRNPAMQQKIMALNTIPAILDNLDAVGKKLNLSDVKIVGGFQNWIKGQTNDPVYTQYMTQRNDAILRLAYAMRGTGMSDEAAKLEQEVASPTMSPRALDAYVRGQLASLQPMLDQYKGVALKPNAATTSVLGSGGGVAPDKDGWVTMPNGVRVREKP